MPTRTATWIRRLRRLRLTRLCFAGGTLAFRYPDEDAVPSEIGVQYLARDFVAVSTQGRVYFIPYKALRWVRAETGSYRHHFARKRLRTLIAQWVDPSTDPEKDMIWHTFINRKGKHFRGAILMVSRIKGVRLRLDGNRVVWLRWNKIGAAIEILE